MPFNVPRLLTDAEIDYRIDLLKDAYVQGRLTIEEFEEAVGKSLRGEVAVMATRPPPDPLTSNWRASAGAGGRVTVLNVGERVLSLMDDDTEDFCLPG